MKKTAEFEAQQARERTASEAKLGDEQDQGVVSEFYGLSNQHQPLGLSTAAFGDDEDAGDSDDAASHPEPANQAAPAKVSAQAGETPDSSDCDGFVRVKYESSASPAHHPQGIAELASPAPITGSFGPAETQAEFQHPAAFAYRPADGTMLDGGLPGPDFESFQAHGGMGMGDAAAFSPFSEQDYYATPSVSQFPPEMIASSAPSHSGHHHPLRHYTSEESLVHSDAVSPTSMPESPSTVSNLRFKSPPPPADIAGRRKMRRPAPLGPTSLRAGPGPKTGIDPQRRTDTASPMRRISSATGSLCGRVQKTFMRPSEPRSPFAMDRTKEALFQSLQGPTASQASMMASLNCAMSPMSPDGQCAGENTVIPNASDEEQGYPFGSLGAMGGLPVYKPEPAIKTTPPGTPSLPMGFQEPYFPASMDHTWNFVPQEEPLPTPSLCSHGGSELEFSVAPQLPGYVASQPVTPSFPPTLAPAYNGFFGTSLGAHTEYHFPDSSYPAESSARSSPVAPPRSKQFQFAQNITPQDFTDKP